MAEFNPVIEALGADEAEQQSPALRSREVIDTKEMSWYELCGHFNVRFGAYRRTSDSYRSAPSPCADIEGRSRVE